MNITPYIHFDPLSFPLYFQVGPTLLVPLSTNYEYTESITAPANTLFRQSNARARTLAKGKLTSAKTTFGVTLGTGLNIPLTDQMKLFLEVQYSPVLNNIADKLRTGEKWTASTFGGTIGIRIGLEEMKSGCLRRSSFGRILQRDPGIPSSPPAA